MKLSDEHKAILAELYAKVDLPLDRLPYTEAFAEICVGFQQRTDLNKHPNDIWLALCALRKAKKLHRKRTPVPA